MPLTASPSRITPVLVAAVSVAAATLSGCGQKGPLYVPHTPEAAQRATLPQTVFGGDKKVPTHESAQDKSATPKKAPPASNAPANP